MKENKELNDFKTGAQVNHAAKPHAKHARVGVKILLVPIPPF